MRVCTLQLIATLLLFGAACDSAPESVEADDVLGGHDTANNSPFDIGADVPGPEDAPAVVDVTDAEEDTVTAPGPWRSELYPEDWTPQTTHPDGHFLHDFSYAGYRGGEAPLGASRLEARFDVTDYGAVGSGDEDATAAIQAAIDAAEAAGGGTVWFPAGLYRVDDRLSVRASRVVLAGEGARTSRIHFTRNTGLSNSAHLRITGALASGAEHMLATDGESRSDVVEVDDATGLVPGDDVAIGWVISEAFVEEHQMTDTWRAFNGTWQPFFRRQIVSIDTSTTPARVTLDVPLRYPAKVRDAASLRVETGMIEECGVEDLGLANATDWDAAWAQSQVHAVSIEAAKDCWVRGVESFASPTAPASGPGAGAHLQSSGILLRHTKRITVADSVLSSTQHRGPGGNGYLFEVRQSNEILFRDLVGRDGRHNFIQNWGFGTSGVVWLRVHSLGGRVYANKTTTTGLTGHSEFHHSLAMANLIDSCTVDDGWSAVNRLQESTGAGHTATQSVFWNTTGAGALRSYQYGFGYVVGTAPTITTHTAAPDMDPALAEALEPFSVWANTWPRDWEEGLGHAGELQPSSLYEDQLRRRLE